VVGVARRGRFNVYFDSDTHSGHIDQKND